MHLSLWKQRIGIFPDHRVLLGTGQICLTAAIIIGRLGPTEAWWGFIEGMLIGISIVTNLAGLWLLGKQESED